GLAPVVDHRGAVAAAVDGVAVAAAAAAGAGQAAGVEQVEEPPVAGPLVHQLGDREVHDAGSGSVPTSDRAGRWLKRANHRIGDMSRTNPIPVWAGFVPDRSPVRRAGPVPRTNPTRGTRRCVGFVSR